MTRAGAQNAAGDGSRELRAIVKSPAAREGQAASQRCLLINVFSLLMAIVLVAMIVTHSFVAYLTAVNPRWALALGGSYPAAELQIANDFMITDRAASDAPTGNAGNPPLGENAAAIRDRITRALYRDPLNARAFELLGALAAPGIAPATDTFMKAALDRSRRTPVALYWLARHKIAQGDTRGAMVLADTLLRIRPSAMAIVAPIVAEIVAVPNGDDQVIDLLAAAPAWRPAFFHFLNDHAKTDISVHFLLALQGARHPPTDREVDDCISSLVKNKKFELAYYTWLQFLPPDKAKDVKLVFNRDFRFEPMPVPFDWSMREGSGVTADIAGDKDQRGRNVLSINLGGGRVNFHPIAQTLILPPGRYRFSVRAKGSIDGQRGLKWQVACLVPASKIIAETPMLLGANPQWQELSSQFDVPPACAAQTLSLILAARSASETLVSGSVAFSDLKLERD